jgi:hypothetical protein
MKAFGVIRLAVFGLGLATALGCDHQSAVPVAASGAMPASDGARLPFDREAQRDGISPTSSVIPPGAQVPAGTSVTIRLKNVLSSATASSDDTFEAALDEPIIVNERIIAERGTVITGRVVDAKPMTPTQAPGYLRLALSSIVIHGKPAFVRTSSNFLKGSGPGRKHATIPVGGDGALMGAVATGKGPLLGNAMVADSTSPASLVIVARDVTVGQERRLTFRLIEPLPLHP